MEGCSLCCTATAELMRRKLDTAQREGIEQLLVAEQQLRTRVYIQPVAAACNTCIPLRHIFALRTGILQWALP